MTFQIQPLPASHFSHLSGASDAALEAAGAIVYVADSKPGFPCRVSLEDAEPGERLLLVNYEHMALPTPYRSAHAIFVREGALVGGGQARPEPGEVPDMIASRMLSVRAFDASGMMLDAEATGGGEAGQVFERLLAVEGAAWLHVHSAARGCYLAKVVAAD